MRRIPLFLLSACFLGLIVSGANASVAVVQSAHGKSSILKPHTKDAIKPKVNDEVPVGSSLFVDYGTLVVRYNGHPLNLLKLGKETKMLVTGEDSCQNFSLQTGLAKVLFQAKKECPKVNVAFPGGSFETSEGKIIFSYLPLINQFAILTLKGKAVISLDKEIDGETQVMIEPNQFYSYNLKSNSSSGPEELNSKNKTQVEKLFELKKEEVDKL